MEVIHSNVGTASAGVHRISTGVQMMPTGMHRISTLVHRISTGVHRIPTGVHRIQSGVHRIPTDVHRISTGVHQIQSGGHRAPTGVHRIETGVRVIHTGVDGLPTWGTQDASPDNVARPGMWAITGRKALRSFAFAMTKPPPKSVPPIQIEMIAPVLGVSPMAPPPSPQHQELTFKKVGRCSHL